MHAAILSNGSVMLLMTEIVSDMPLHGNLATSQLLPYYQSQKAMADNSIIHFVLP